MLFSTFTALLVALPFASATFCKSNQFWYNNKSCCLNKGGHSTPDAGLPPPGTSCPKTDANWYWSRNKFCCVPGNENHHDHPDCPAGFNWNQGASTCVKIPVTPKPPSSCGNNQFWWPGKACCLPHGGPPKPAPPPPTTSCPGDWSWSHDHGCCTPHHPPAGPPPCPPKWTWCSQIFQCQPPPPTMPPQPSAHPRRSLHKSRAAPLCQKNHSACPIATAKGLSVDFECLDLANEITSCGGCASQGKGQDCTTIPNAKSVGCAKSQCSILSCNAGFTLAEDGKTCAADLSNRGL